jgi:hypothetical protein
MHFFIGHLTNQKRIAEKGAVSCFVRDPSDPRLSEKAQIG